MTRAAVYIRVSSDPQLSRFGPAVQRETVDAYAQRVGLELVHTYEDAITGKAARRQALDQLLDHAPRYDAVVLSSVDRLARRVPVAYGVLAELIDTGLEVHSADMGVVDLDDDASSVQFGIRSLFADQDHRRITRRLSDARVAKVQRGQPVVPLDGYGWRRGVADEREQHWARWMYRRVAEAGTLRVSVELAEQGVTTRHGRPWTPSRINDYIRNPTNKGEFQYGRKSGRVRAVAPVPAIVPPEDWARAVAALDRRVTHRGRRGHRLDVFPLTGRVVCGSCGRAVGGVTYNKGRNHSYICTNLFQSPHLRRPCKTVRYFPAAAVHEALLSSLRSALSDPALLAPLLRPPPPVVVDTAAMRQDVTRRLARLDAAYEAGAYQPDEYAARRRALLTEREALAVPGVPEQAPPPDLGAVGAALSAALSLPRLADAVDALRLQGVLHPDGRLDVTVDA